MLELIVLGAFSAALLLCAALGISVLYALIFGYILLRDMHLKSIIRLRRSPKCPCRE